MSKTRVLHVLSGLDLGGVSRVVTTLFEKIDREHFHFDFYVMDREEGALEHRIRELGGHVHRSNSSEMDVFDGRFRILCCLRELRFLFREHGYHAVHCHNNNLSALVLLMAFVCGIQKRFVHSHNVAPQARRKGWITDLLIRMNRIGLFLLSTKEIACSHQAANYLFGQSRFGRGKQRIIFNGLSLDEYSAVRSGDRDGMRFLFVGRVTTIKNPLFALEVFKHIHEKCATAKMTFIANVNTMDMKCEALYKQLVERIQSYQLNSDCLVLPPQTDMPSVYRKNDMLLLPSLAEGFPMVALEAQCAGMNVFLSDTIPNDVDCGGCHFLNLESGAEVWADKILSTLGNKEHRSIDMGKVDIVNIVNEYEQVYQE